MSIHVPTPPLQTLPPWSLDCQKTRSIFSYLCFTFFILCIFLNGFRINSVSAASEEIQVYADDKEDPGKMSVDWHNSFVFSGRSTAQFAGEQPPRHVYRLTPEINYGLTKTLELGVYLLSNRSEQGHWNGEGVKLRLKYIAPHEDQGLYWGVNFETGKLARAVSLYPLNDQLKTILGWNLGVWNIAMNLNFDKSLNKGSGPVTESFAFKINYATHEKTRWGIESYNDLGAWRRWGYLNEEAKTLFATVDTEILGHELNFGIGRGFNGIGDQWLMKFIINTPF